MTEERITQRTVTIVMIVIAALAFVFSFGNVWALAVRLGVPRPVAPLIAPMVDLSVVGLLVALRYLSLRGVPADKLNAATRLMHLSGLLTLGLNIAEPIITRHYGRAAVDAVAPLLLLGWGSVGPTLLRHFHAVTTPGLTEPATDSVPVVTEPAPAKVVVPAPVPTPVPGSAPAPAVAVPEALLEAARSIATSHLAAHGEVITPAQLRARLGVAEPLATAAHAQL